MSRGSYRSVFSVIFDDPDYQKLTPHARLVLLTARQCQDAGPAAIFRYYSETLAHQTGLTVLQVKQALAALTSSGWVLLDDHVLWVRNGLRFDPTITLANRKHRAAVIKGLSRLPKSPIVLKFCDYYKIEYPSGWPSIAMPFTETETETETERTTTTTSPAATDVRGPEWGTPEGLVLLFNQHVPSGCPRVTMLTAGRRKKATQALQAFPTSETWLSLCGEIGRSAFLMGRRPSQDHPNFRATFDWLLTKGKDGTENIVKVLEGRYRDTQPAGLEDDDDDGA